ncbi:MAG: S1 family peptidase [Actinomycetota bacterium]|nr:S1 family peptidase [Actinomycetota bacterium]
MVLRRVLGVVTACALVLGVAVAPVHGKRRATQPAWGGADSPIRPGSSMGGCTFNFVFYTPGTVRKQPRAFIGTAAHCTDKVGERVEHASVGEIGTVVYDSDLVNSEVDFTLIEIDRDKVSQTNPEVLHWGGPTRSITADDLAIGDRIDIYGYGVGLGATEQTRPRYGFLVGYNEKEYQADMPAVNGDSGSPLIHHETGAALGIISRYGIAIPPSTDLGPLMPWIFEELKAAGFNVRLATVSR